MYHATKATLALVGTLVFAGAASATTTPVDNWLIVRDSAAGMVVTNGNTNSPTFAGPADALDNASLRGTWGSATTLAIGDTITVTGSISWAGTITGWSGLRVGLFDSTTGDFLTGAAGYKGVTGTSIGTDVATDKIATGRTNGFYMSDSSNAVSIALNDDTASGNWGDNVSFDYTFEIERLGATSLDIRFSLTGSNGASMYMTATDNSATTFTYDTVGYNFGNNADTDSAVFSNVNVITAAVPEPASLAMVGLAGVAMLFRRRGH